MAEMPIETMAKAPRPGVNSLSGMSLNTTDKQFFASEV
jgi:hypothetical protein